MSEKKSISDMSIEEISSNTSDEAVETSRSFSRHGDNKDALVLVEELSSELEQAYAKILEIEKKLGKKGGNKNA